MKILIVLKEYYIEKLFMISRKYIFKTYKLSFGIIFSFHNPISIISANYQISNLIYTTRILKSMYK